MIADRIGSLTRDPGGALMLAFHDGPSHGEFEAWAVDFVRRIDAAIVDAIDGPRLWRLQVDGAALCLLLSEQHGTFLVAYEAAFEPALRRVHQELEAVAARIATRGD